MALHKNDIHRSEMGSFFFFERYRGMAEELMAPCLRMTRTNRVAWKIERVVPIQG